MAMNVYLGPANGIRTSGVRPVGTLDDRIHFCADDYTWSVADSNYFYFAWCDRSRKYQNTRPDADINLAKIKP